MRIYLSHFFRVFLGFDTQFSSIEPLLIGALAFQGCATKAQSSDANVGGIGIWPPAGTKPGYETFERPLFAEILKQIHTTLEEADWICTNPITKKQFPLMETTYQSSYRHKTADWGCAIYANPGVVGVTFKKTDFQSRQSHRLDGY